MFPPPIKAILLTFSILSPYTVYYQFQIKDEIKAARMLATEALTRPLATLSQRERGNSILSPSGREIERGYVEEPKTSQRR
jgi:hypothetical protein